MTSPFGSAALHPGATDIRVPVARPSLPALERFTAAMEEVWETARLSNEGPFGREIERQFADYCGLPGAALCASSCDLALTLAIRALDLPPGSRALVPSLGFPSTVHALQWNGLRAQFVDVDPHDWCVGPEQLRAALPDAAGVSLIVATHLFGAPCDVRGLAELAGSLDARLVFDAAHAAATWTADEHVCAFGDASVVSLSATKIVTAAEGGIAVLVDPAHAERFRRLRAYGLDDDRVSREQGLNAKLSELNAALGVLAFEQIEHEVARRSAHVERYRSLLRDVPGLRLQAVAPGARATPTMFVVDVGRRRPEIRTSLRERGIESRPYFPALHRMPRLAGIQRAEMVVTDHLDESLLALPLYSELEAETIVEICEIVAQAAEAPQAQDG
jgi:dTDP-4-amino-4,6-dideoxygalactose transaminase